MLPLSVLLPPLEQCLHFPLHALVITNSIRLGSMYIGHLDLPCFAVMFNRHLGQHIITVMITVRVNDDIFLASHDQRFVDISKYDLELELMQDRYIVIAYERDGRFQLTRFLHCIYMYRPQGKTEPLIESDGMCVVVCRYQP